MNQKPIPWMFGALAAALVLVIGVGSGLAEPVPGGTLNLKGVPMFVTPLYIPPPMPTSSDPLLDYQIAVRQFNQQILPTGKPMTTVWGYGSIDDPASFHYPAATIEAEVGMPVRVKWINDLKDPVTGKFLLHLLPVDQTLHWANPPMDCLDGSMMTDCRGQSQALYTGPVPIISHLHGAHVGPESDGYPEAWYLPAANNLDGFATRGSHFGQIAGAPDIPGQAIFEYPNTQRAATLWFHDHTLGMTRVNVYAGPVGFYLLRGSVGDADAAVEAGLPSGAYEIPLVIQDKSFNADGSLFYPDNRAFFEGLEKDQLQIPFIPDETRGGETSDVSPIWNPEFFGNTMVVNGNTWPYLDVEPRQYRFRFLNGSDSRFLILTAPGITFHQIGADGGFLPAPDARTELLLGPAERADVIVDFSGLKVGNKVTLFNVGPDEPFGGGTPGIDFDAADPGTTGQVMQFRVVKAKGVDSSTPVANLQLPAPAPLGKASVTRKLSLNEDESATVFVQVDEAGEYILNDNSNLVEVAASDPNAAPFGPTSARLGILDKKGNPVPKFWMNSITENPKLGATEVWEIFNFTADAHPIHIHLVQFEILNRQALVTDDEGMAEPPARLLGNPRGPDPGEFGRKDTVIVYPGEVARVKAVFDIPGLFVWHCHILSHEDNEMMRPYFVGKVPAGM